MISTSHIAKYNHLPVTAQFLTYTQMCVLTIGVLFLLPPTGGYIWEPWIINCCSGMLYTLLVYLTTRLTNTGNTLVGIALTALFLALFCPGADRFFQRDEQGLQELASQCIVPFFISQYLRVSRKDFHRWYFLMALMGVFCSYTHNGITIPLCGTFVYLSFLHRHQFFRRACWPMVVGFVIGTGLSIWQVYSDSLTMVTNPVVITSVTSIALTTLWDTKVFVLAIALTAYLATRHEGLHAIKGIIKRQYVISICLIMSLVTMPFAPLGIENAVTGVCFFSMFWALFLCQYVGLKYFNKRF